MPTKSEILIDNSNYHRIKKFERVKKAKESVEMFLKKATVEMFLKKETVTSDGFDGDLTPINAANK